MAFTTSSAGIGIQIKPTGSDIWTEVGTLMPGATWQFGDGPEAGKITMSKRPPGLEFTINADSAGLMFGTDRITSSRIADSPITTTSRRNMLYPGALTLTDANGMAVTITPTGKSGYTISTEPDSAAVRVNNRMHQALREHIERCLNYEKSTDEA